jgi:hypothetical protein
MKEKKKKDKKRNQTREKGKTKFGRSIDRSEK